MNTKLGNVKIHDRKLVITFVAIVLLGKFSKDVLTALIHSELGILAYKDLTSKDTKYEIHGIHEIFVRYLFHFVDSS